MACLLQHLGRLVGHVSVIGHVDCLLLVALNFLEFIDSYLYFLNSFIDCLHCYSELVNLLGDGQADIGNGIVNMGLCLIDGLRNVAFNTVNLLLESSIHFDERGSHVVNFRFDCLTGLVEPIGDSSNVQSIVSVSVQLLQAGDRTIESGVDFLNSSVEERVLIISLIIVNLRFNIGDSVVVS